MGESGAERLIIYETDGMANQGSTPGNGFSSGSYYNSYYRIQPGQPLNSAGYSQTTLLQTIQNICNDKNGNPVTGPGITPVHAEPGLPGLRHPGQAGDHPVRCLRRDLRDPVVDPDQLGQPASADLCSSAARSSPPAPPIPTNGFKWCIGTIDQTANPLDQRVPDDHEPDARADHADQVGRRGCIARGGGQSAPESGTIMGRSSCRRVLGPCAFPPGRDGGPARCRSRIAPRAPGQV